MRDSFIVTRTFSHNNREAFDLSLIDIDFGEGNPHIYLLRSVTLPFQLLNKFYDLLDENKIVQNGSYSYEYCFDLIETIASFISDQNKLYSPFFYPSNFLDSNNAIATDFIENYTNVKKEIRLKKYMCFDETSIKVLLFQNLLFLIKSMGKKFIFQKKTISRLEFEFFIKDIETGISYVEIYNELHSFTLVFKKENKIPVCVIAQCKMKQIKYAIVTGNESISI
jgi:hypothetical protein